MYDWYLQYVLLCRSYKRIKPEEHNIAPDEVDNRHLVGEIVESDELGMIGIVVAATGPLLEVRNVVLNTDDVCRDHLFVDSSAVHVAGPKIEIPWYAFLSLYSLLFDAPQYVIVTRID